MISVAASLEVNEEEKRSSLGQALHLSVFKGRLSTLESEQKTVDSGLWEGCRESRRCSRHTYPESYITEYTSIPRQQKTVDSGTSTVIKVSCRRMHSWNRGGNCDHVVNTSAADKECVLSPQGGTKSLFSRPLCCTAGRRTPASSGTSPGARNGGFGSTLKGGGTRW